LHLRYYQEKLGVAPEAQEALVSDVVRKYVEGVCWVMKYYYDGVASWRWYYPYHYAPFASDIKNIGTMQVGRLGLERWPAAAAAACCNTHTICIPSLRCITASDA
jgi:hypothetical protein